MNKLNIDFYIDPNTNYEEHKVNILKECLSLWAKKDNDKFYPNSDNFRFCFEEVEIPEGNEIMMFHCYTNKEWLDEHHIYTEISKLQTYFED